MKYVRGTDLPYIPLSHETADIPEVLKKVLFRDTEVSAGHIQMINWAKIQPGGSVKPHTHVDMQELFIIVAGTIIARVDNTEVEMKTGDALLAEAGEHHEMKNPGEAEAFYLAIGIVPH